MRFLIFGQCSNCIKLTKKYDEEHVRFQTSGQIVIQELYDLKAKLNDKNSGGEKDARRASGGTPVHARRVSVVTSPDASPASSSPTG